MPAAYTPLPNRQNPNRSGTGAGGMRDATMQAGYSPLYNAAPWSALNQPAPPPTQGISQTQITRDSQSIGQPLGGMFGLPGLPATPTGGVPPTGTMPTGPTGPAAPTTTRPSPLAGGPPLNTNFTPLSLPTRESQNQLMALAAQRANPIQALNRAVGNRGITADSGVVLGNMAGPMQDIYRQGALGAANLGIDDQVMRDEHALRGILGLGQADIGRARAGARRDRIGINAQNQLSGSFADLLRSLGGMFNMNDLGGII